MTGAIPRIAISLGDPAGIGPDVGLALAARDWPAELVFITDRDALAVRARALSEQIALRDYAPSAPPAQSLRQQITVLHIPLREKVRAGRPDPANAPAVLEVLQRAARGCGSGEFDAMVTAPVAKATIAQSGTPFSGHTEYLAALTGTAQVVMLLATGDLRVALATTHIPLAAVPAAISAAHLRALLPVLHGEMQRKFAIADPRIAVLGLNPHAGESGTLGTEEREIIAPVLEEFRAQGMRLLGPLPADTAFSPDTRAATDAFLAMYHDQGLPVLKYAGFGGAVNITLGLPIIRTSVDHGTAFELAGTGRASSGSMAAAVEQALELVARAGKGSPL